MSKNEDESKQRGKSQTFYIDEPVLKEIKIDAKKKKRSKSFIVNEILREHYTSKDRIKKDTE